MTTNKLLEQLKKDRKIFESEIEMDLEDYAHDLANDARNLTMAIAKMYGKYGQEAGKAVSNYVTKCIAEDSIADADEVADVVRLATGQQPKF